MTPTLYGYWRSSAAYRVRIALNLKGLSADHIPVNLRLGQQGEEAYRRLAPHGLVPMYAGAGGTVRITQSLAIIEYLEELQPDPPLLPWPGREPGGRSGHGLSNRL